MTTMMSNMAFTESSCQIFIFQMAIHFSGKICQQVVFIVNGIVLNTLALFKENKDSLVSQLEVL